MQEELTKVNETAWNQLSYEAWVHRFGDPPMAAKKLLQDPISKLNTIYEYFGNVKNKKIVNLLGSHGTKAVALAVLGGEVTVVDFSFENCRYALELAGACNTKLNYIVSDVLNIPESEINKDFNIAFCELGILHYFTDLHPFFQVCNSLLDVGGKLIVQDFHPISTKLITSKGKKHKVTGDYFASELVETEVAYMKFVPGMEELSEDDRAAFQKALIRKWTLGEVVTAIAQAGFKIELLHEKEGANPEDKGIPKLFTVTAIKL